jgi:hypothetical protein
MMSKMKNFYEKVNDLLLNENTDWDVLKKAICQKYSLFDLYSTEEVKREIEMESISVEELFEKEDVIEYLSDKDISDFMSDRGLKNFIIEYLEFNL